MDEEAARLIQLQSEMEQQMKSTQSPSSSEWNSGYNHNILKKFNFIYNGFQ
jgi:hypothetical protein